jgi:hypothetical protein
MISADTLVKVHGLNPEFAVLIAKLFSSLEAAGLQPEVTSGFRDPEYQRLLQIQWDSGDTTGLTTRPATDSLHTRMENGEKNALAVDIKSRDYRRAGDIAESLGIGAGINFSTPDPGHYYDLTAQRSRSLEKTGGGIVAFLTGIGAFFLYKKFWRKT